MFHLFVSAFLLVAIYLFSAAIAGVMITINENELIRRHGASSMKLHDWRVIVASMSGLVFWSEASLICFGPRLMLVWSVIIFGPLLPFLIIAIFDKQINRVPQKKPVVPAVPQARPEPAMASSEMPPVPV